MVEARKIQTMLQIKYIAVPTAHIFSGLYIKEGYVGRE